MSTPQHNQVCDQLDRLVDTIGLLPTDQQLQTLDRAISRLQARQAHALRRLETEGGLEGSGAKTVGAWARLHLRRSVSAHRIKLRARSLVQLPGFAAAFEAGEVTDEHVDTLLRWVKPCGGIDVLQQHEHTLLTLARQVAPRELAEALDQLAELANPDRDADRIAALAKRSFTCTKVGDLVHVDAMVEPALGEALKTAVEADSRRPTGTNRVDDGRTLLQRRADAFAEIVLRGIGAVTDPQDRRGRLRAQVSITVTLDELRGIAGAPKALLAHFGAVPTPTVQRLVCDGDLARVVLDTATGLPLDVGRNSRLAKKHQRRALQAIFRGCAFPGCTVPFRFCEIHHLDWWSRGGATDLALLIPYCWTHHHFLHEHGFTVSRDTTTDGDRLGHRRPDGTPLPDPDPPLRIAIEQLRLEHVPPEHPPDESRDPPDAA